MFAVALLGTFWRDFNHSNLDFALGPLGYVLLPPQSGLRQWVPTFPFPWRRRLAQDGVLLGRLTRIVMETVLAFYAARAAPQGWAGAKSGGVSVVQRTSSDLRLNPHLQLVGFWPAPSRWTSSPARSARGG